jgi:hypothetical protein
MVVNGCTIVSNPTPTHFTNCSNATNLATDLSGLDLLLCEPDGSSVRGLSYTEPDHAALHCRHFILQNLLERPLPIYVVPLRHLLRLTISESMSSL